MLLKNNRILDTLIKIEKGCPKGQPFFLAQLHTKIIVPQIRKLLSLFLKLANLRFILILILSIKRVQF